MAFSPVTSWQIEGKKVEAVADFISWAAESLRMVTAAMKLRRLLRVRKVMANLEHIFKSIPLLIKVHLVKVLVFPIVMCRYWTIKSWTIKKAEH